jgi:hypothetical protein
MLSCRACRLEANGGVVEFVACLSMRASMVRCGDSSSSEVWRYGVVVGAGAAAATASAAAAAGVAAVGLAGRDRERFSRGRACDGVFLDDGAMMAVRAHGVLVDGCLSEDLQTYSLQQSTVDSRQPTSPRQPVHLHKRALNQGPCAESSFLPVPACQFTSGRRCRQLPIGLDAPPWSRRSAS